MKKSITQQRSGFTNYYKKKTLKDIPGGFSGGVTPDPIPNSEVKPTRADGTSTAGFWESRSLPGFYLKGRQNPVFPDSDGT